MLGIGLVFGGRLESIVRSVVEGSVGSMVTAVETAVVGGAW